MAAAESELQYLRLLTHVVSLSGQLLRGEGERRPPKPLTRTQNFLETHMGSLARRFARNLGHYHCAMPVPAVLESATLIRTVIC